MLCDRAASTYCCSWFPHQVQKSYGQPELASRVVAAAELPFPGVSVCNQPAESPNLQPSQGNCLITNDVATAVRECACD